MYVLGTILRVLLVLIVIALIAIFLVYPGVAFGHPIWGPWNLGSAPVPTVIAYTPVPTSVPTVIVVAPTAQPTQVPSQPTAMPSQPTVQPSQPTAIATAQPGAGAPVRINKCDWLVRNFPQGNPIGTPGQVQQLGARMANVQQERIRTHIFLCPSGTVYDGYIVLGPNEGYGGNVTMSVPMPGTAIDSHATATFTGRTQKLGVDTIRAFDGQVTGLSMTFWPWLDEAPPVSDTTLFGGPFTSSPGGTTPSQPAPVTTPVASTSQCMQPDQLASQNGWQNLGFADKKFGGLRVQLSSSGTLPASWEALTGGKSIKETDPERSMTSGVWTIYPPFSCRDALGYSK